MPAKGQFKVTISPEELRRLHIIEGKSSYEIAKLLGVSRTIILRYMKRLGVPHRTFKMSGSELPERVRGYIAGIIDGEGTVTIIVIRRKRSYLSTIYVDNTDLSLLKKIRELCGFGSLYRHSSRKQETKQRRLYRLKFSSTHLRILLPQITPYLIRKRRQAEILMEVLNYVKLGNNQHTQRPIEKLEALVNEIRRLNQRGLGDEQE
jgi:hypothetical protein